MIEVTLKNRLISWVKKYWVFFIFLFLNLLFYGTFVIKHYAADTYFTEALGWKITVLQYFSNGRWLMSLLSLFCGFFHISSTHEQFISWSIAVLSVSLASYIVYTLLKNRFNAENKRPQNGWIVLISFMLISNVFLIEYFIFAEYTGAMCLGIFFNVLGAKYILKFMENIKWKYYFLGILFAILGINGHQGNFAILILVCVLCTYGMFDSFKKFIAQNFIIGSAYLIPALINMFEVRIGNAARLSNGHIDLIASFLKSTDGLKVLLKTTANFMPAYFYIVCIFIGGLFFIYHIIQKKEWKMLLIGAYWFIIASLGIYAPLMITDYNYIDAASRTVYILGSALPVILIGLLYLDVSLKNSFFLPLFTLFFLAVQYWGITRTTTSHYFANAVDRYEAQYIGNYLREYEAQNGVQVTKMALYWDKNVSGFAPGILAGYGAINERIMSNGWAAPLAVMCLDGYQIEAVETSDEVYQQYFKDKDWNQMDEEQFVVIGDTLHFCSY